MKPKNKCWIVTKNPQFFKDIVGFENEEYDFCSLKDMLLPKRISIDSETTGLSFLNDDIFCIQIGTGVNNYLVDLQDYSTTLKFKEYENITQYFQELIPYIQDKELVLHNAAFDLKFFYKYNFFPNNVFDTFLASKILYNGSPPNVLHNFGACMKRELNLIYDKTEQANISKVKLSQLSTILYSFNDVDKLLELHSSLWNSLVAYGSLETYLLHCRHIKALAYMESCGLTLNVRDWKVKMEEDKLNADKKAQEIVDYIYDKLPKYRDNQISLFDTVKKLKVQLSSVKQMIPVFKDFGIEVLNEENKESIEEGVIQKSKHEFVKLWLEWKSYNHRCTTFGQNILDKTVPIDNNYAKIFTSFVPILDTARLSSRKGDVNTLNLPSDSKTRKCFQAPKGFVNICCDMDNQESRILADKSKDELMIKSVLDDLDLHSEFARYIYPEIKNLSDSDIKKFHKEKRSIAKGGRFCFAYGGGGYTAAQNLNIPLEEGMKLEKLYKEIHPNVYIWGNENLNNAIKTGYIESEMGFKLKLPEYSSFLEYHKIIQDKSKQFWEIYRVGKQEYKTYFESIEENKKNKEIEIYKIQKQEAYNLYRENKSVISKYFQLKSQYFRLALNNPIQASASHQIKLATCLLFEFILENNHQWKARIVVIPHDEILMEVEESLADLYKEKLGYFMRQAGDYFLTSGIIKAGAEANIGKDWYEAK